MLLSESLFEIPRYHNNSWDNNQSPSSSEGSDYSSSPPKSCSFSPYCPLDSLMPRSDYADYTVLDNTKPAVPTQCPANSYCNANVDACDFDSSLYDNLFDIMSCISSDFTSMKPLVRPESTKLGVEIKQEPDAALTYCDLSKSQASCSRTLSRESDSFGKGLPQKSMSTVMSPSFSPTSSCCRVLPARPSACVKQEPLGGDTSSAFDISCLVGDAVGPIIKEALLDDVVKTSSELGIGPDPYQWSIADVHTWLCYTSKIFEIPMANCNVQISGGTLCELTEEQLRELWPLQADIIYGYLDLWKKRGKVAAFIGHQQNQPRQQQEHHHHQHQQQHQYQQQPQQRMLPCQEQTHLPNPQMLAESSSSSQPYPLPPERGFIGMSPLMHWGRSTPSPSQKSDLSGTSDEDTKCPRNSQSNIHLWQFLKELLNNPRSYGSFIRWLDRPKGIFKIEDSVTVAKLWGKRKNRPAMNYDKLSRSLRQYYKKGIMKKTERSQRLVYQFCQPYRM